MKASPPRLLALVVSMAACSFATLCAQDAVVQKDGKSSSGTITGVRANAVRIKIGPVETAVPLANVKSVTMAPPADYTAAVEAWSKGDAAATITKLIPVVQTFKGLPTLWAERACSILPEVYLTINKPAEAEAALAEFQKLYPGSTSSTQLLLARLSLSKKDFIGAKARLEPLVKEAKAAKLPKGSEAVTYSQALLLMGNVQEQSGQKPEALENYLLVTTIFNKDHAATAQAAERAKVLNEEKVVVP